MPTPAIPTVAVPDPQDTVTSLSSINVEGMDLNRIIAHVFANNESLNPLREKARQRQLNIESEGNALIEAMAKQATAQSQVTLAEQASKLALQEAALKRQQQIGVDINNPASDRLAKLAAWMEEESNTHRASIERIQQLDSVGFADNPIQWAINQFKIDSEKDTANTALKAKEAYAQEMAALHNLAQENVQTLVQSKLAKTQAELQATLDLNAAQATEAASKQRMLNSNSNLSAIGQIYAMTADEHSVWFKAAQLKKDAEDRERDARKDELRYKMLELQFEGLLKDKQNKEALVKDMREFAVDKLGADPNAVAAAPEDLILNHQPLKENYLQIFGIGHPKGPYTALSAMEAMNNPANKMLETPVAAWIRGQLVDMKPSAELLSRPKAEQDKWYDEQLKEKAATELKGDADNSLLYRIPSVGELKYMAGPDSKALTGNSLMKYISAAPGTTRYSSKQLIGFAIKDPIYKENGAARAKLIKDIAQFARVSVNYTSTSRMHEAFGLPSQHLITNGYKIMPTELLKAANEKIPDELSKRYFDITQEGDVQALVNLAIDQPSSFYQKPVFQPNFGNELRAADPIYKESKEVGKKPSSKKKGDK